MKKKNSLYGIVALSVVLMMSIALGASARPASVTGTGESPQSVRVDSTSQSGPQYEYKYMVSGTVVDQEGEPVIGASVVIKGTTVGTCTDIDGNYSIPTNSLPVTLVISYIGCKTREIIVG